jgi:Fe-Mn family superoxide dismutase
MPINVHTLPFDPARLHGLSERIVMSHHKNNYGGAVKRLSAIRSALAALDPAAASGFMLNGLKREELIAANSMRLHEIHFDGLGGDGTLEAGPLATMIAAAFGSVERWRAEFVALGKALAGGSGWVLLSWSPREGRLVNQWAADHTHALADATPILALDMYEHAYHLDFGADAGAWVETFMRNVAWPRVAQRFEAAVAASAMPFEIAPRELVAAASAVVIDVRRAPVFAAASTKIGGANIDGAHWRDPEAVDTWAAELTPEAPVIVYCVHGHAISRGAAARLRAAGLNARSIAGGIERWQAEGLPLHAKEDKP